MSPITAEQAWAATDPSHTDEERKTSAQAIMAGVAANDAYYSSRSQLEQLIAHAQGDQVVTHASLNAPESAPLPAGDPTGGAGQIAAPVTVAGGASETTDATSVDETIEDKLRKQIEALGATPEA